MRFGVLIGEKEAVVENGGTINVGEVTTVRLVPDI